MSKQKIAKSKLKSIASSWFKNLILKSDISNLSEVFTLIAKPYFNEGLSQYLQDNTTLALEMFEEANYVMWYKNERLNRYGQLTGYFMGNCYYLIRKKGEICHNLISSIRFFDFPYFHVIQLSPRTYFLSKIYLMNAFFELINIINQLTYDDKEYIYCLTNNNFSLNGYGLDFSLLAIVDYQKNPSIDKLIEGLLKKVNQNIQNVKNDYNEDKFLEYVFLLNYGKYYYHLSYLQEEKVLLSKAIDCFTRAKLLLPKTNFPLRDKELNIILIKTLSRIASLDSNVKYLIEADTILENFIKTISSKQDFLLATLYYYKGMIGNELLKFESNDKQKLIKLNRYFEKALNIFKDIQNKSSFAGEEKASLMLNIGLTYIAIANQQKMLKNIAFVKSSKMAIDAIKSAKNYYERFEFKYDSKKAEKIILLLHTYAIPNFPDSFLDMAEINNDEKKELDLFVYEMLD
jgi:hypothetical protein